MKLTGIDKRIGPDLILEASARPRIPCGTFQGWLAQGGWIKRFTLAARPGTYFRVIEPGEIRPATRSRSCTGPTTTSPSPCRSGR